MLSKKRMCLRSVTKKKRSFAERICDDLCEEILKYLPIEDRFRLEGVSKQFQRTIFKSQNIVSLKFNDNSGHILKKCEILLKKCPNVNQIKISHLYPLSPFLIDRHTDDSDSDVEDDELDNDWNIFDKYKKLVEIIIKNCINLTDFDFYSDYMSEENRNNFIEKFGSKLISVNFKNCEKPEVFLSSIRVLNIKKVVINRINSAFSQLFFNKLKSLEIKELDEKDIKPFELFIERHRKSLRFLTVRNVRFDGENSESFTQQLTKIVSKLDQLIHLSLISEMSYLNNCCHFNDCLKQIALNCKQLRSFECSLHYEPGIQDVLSSLKSQKHLKRLKLDLKHYGCLEEKVEMAKLSKAVNKPKNSFKIFKDLQNITHLSLELPWISRECSERKLKHIDIYLPNLQFFKINGIFIPSEGLTDILSRLSKLETLKMTFQIEPNKIEFAEKCPRLKVKKFSVVPATR